MPPSMLAIWVASGLLALLGAAGVAGAMLLSARRLGAGVPIVGDEGSDSRCPCCKYSTAGLEEDYCPECGMRFEVSARVRERFRRRGIAGAGVAAMLLAGVGFPISDALQNGPAHALPTAALVELLAWSPEWGDAPAAELRSRADSRLMRGWERRELARVCRAAVGDGRTEASARRRAAMLLALVPAEAGDATGAAMLHDADPAIRAEGTTLISRQTTSDAAVRSRLVSMACDDGSPLVRKRAIDALSRLGESGPEACRAFRRGLVDSNEGVRRRALIAMVYGRGDEGTAAGVATVAIADRDENVRELAVVLLGMLAERQRALPAQGATMGVVGMVGG